VETVDRNAVVAYVSRCARVIRRHEAYLTRLDAALGDGDHGDNLAMGFRVIEEDIAVDGADERSLSELLRRTGHLLVTHVGGASGPLYGTAFIEAAHVAGAAAELSTELIGEMLEAAASGLARRGRCSVGDKTILDTLRPAADAFAGALRAGELLDRCMAAAVHAGARGMRATRPMVARRGLALRLGARSAGHLDPGAVSCLLLLRSMATRRTDTTQQAQPLGATAQ
jgi:dihydroxyacetone kinase-like protein